MNYKLVMYNCGNTLSALHEDPTQILKEDRKSLIIKVETLQKYPLSTLDTWMESLKVAYERKALELFGQQLASNQKTNISKITGA